MVDPEGERRLSMIAGSGLFAMRDYTGGELVDTLDHDVDREGDLGPYNHSCDPKLGWSGERGLVALRDIAAGDELTLDYATCLDDPDYLLRCHCETYRCRQLIEGTDWQIPQLQTRYAGHWAPRIRARIEDLEPRG